MHAQNAENVLICECVVVMIGTLTVLVVLVLVLVVATLIPALLSFSFSSFLTWLVSVEVNKYC